MIDDELNRLLDDVGENDDFTQVRDSQLQSNKSIARKSDRNTGQDFAGQSQQEYSQFINKLKSDKDILLFDCGYINILTVHFENSKKIESFINDTSLPNSVLDAIRKYKYSYLRNIENIAKYYNDFLTSQNDSNLKKKARLDYPMAFADQNYSDNRINFLILKEIFLRLREYNSFFRKEFDELRNGIDGISMIPEGKELYGRLADIISASLGYCRKTDRFITFIGLNLSLSENDTNVLEKDIYNRIYYRDTINYAYSALFRSENNSDDRKNISDGHLKIETEPAAEPVKPKVHKLRQELKTSHPKKEVPENLEFENLAFSAPGRSMWNTKEPYIISVKNDVFTRNLEDLKKTVYFTRTVEDVKMMNANVKRAMLRTVSGVAEDNVKKYGRYIDSAVTEIYNLISEKLEVSDDLLDLIFYHTGPENIFKIIKSGFDSESIGLCFKELGQNKFSRFFPEEFIKVEILNWFERNINSRNIPFNSIQEFNEIKNLMETRYNMMLEESMNKIETAARHFQEQSGKIIDRNAMLHKKAKELFTLPMMYLFRRFVEKTIFSADIS